MEYIVRMKRFVRMNDNVCCDVSKQFPSASTAPASPAGKAPSYSTTKTPKKKERSFRAKSAPQDDSGKAIQGERLSMVRHSQQARAAAAS